MKQKCRDIKIPGEPSPPGVEPPVVEPPAVDPPEVEPPVVTPPAPKPDPEPTPNPKPEPPQQQKEVINFESFSTGVFEYSFDRDIQERIACSRAENEAFYQTRMLCRNANGRMIEHEETCSSCETNGDGVKCEAKATLSCEVMK